MDNAGGHGEKEVIEEYTKKLAERGIEIQYQPPSSPGTNVLQLGGVEVDSG